MKLLELLEGLNIKESAFWRGVFVVECWRNRKLVWVERSKNLIVNQGLNHALNVIFHGETQIGTWYCAFVESNTTPAAGMTYASPTYTECTAYTEANRQEYVEAESTAQKTSNTSNKATININATKTLYGAAIVGGGSAPSTKGDTAGGGKLFCFSLFATSRGVISGDIVRLTYEVTSESA
jgi:hypothetical protein